jgi:hypothetical protein
MQNVWVLADENRNSNKSTNLCNTAPIKYLESVVNGSLAADRHDEGSSCLSATFRWERDKK